MLMPQILGMSFALVLAATPPKARARDGEYPDPLPIALVPVVELLSLVVDLLAVAELMLKCR